MSIIILNFCRWILVLVIFIERRMWEYEWRIIYDTLLTERTEAIECMYDLVILDGCGISNRGMIYLKGMKKLTQLQINGNNVSQAVLTSVFLNMRVLFHYFYPSYFHLIGDYGAKKRLHENVNSGTKIWLSKHWWTDIILVKFVLLAKNIELQQLLVYF